MITGEVQKIGDPVATLGNLRASIQRRINKKAVGVASKPAVKDLRARMPKRTGMAKRSVSRKVGVSRRKGEVFAVIGAKANITGERNGQKVQPSKYFHLIEGGRKAVTLKKGKAMPIAPGIFRASVRPASGKRVLAASLQSVTPQYFELLRDTYTTEIAKELAKAPK